MSTSTTVAAMSVLMQAAGSVADVVDIPSARDNTIFEYTPPAQALSNGAGPGMFAGINQTGQIRRALIRFDIAGAIPSGATVTAVTLKLNCEQSISLNTTVSLHRLLSDWGEGTSVGGGFGGGAGAPATTDDATWIHRFFPATMWTSPGGDFEPGASGTAIVSGPGAYEWEAPAMVADVQDWLDTPATNFGWLIFGDETTNGTAKRFNTKEAPVANRPVLTVEFTPACYPDCSGDGVLTVADFGCFQTQFVLGTPYADCNGDGFRTVGDFGCFQTRFVQGCP